MIKFIEGKNKTKKGFIHQNFLKKISGGFTLVETLVAVSIFSVSVIALMSFLATNISNTGYAKNKIIAAYLAQEGIEYIRNMRDTYVLYPTNNGGWTSFKAKISPCTSSNGCGYDKSIAETSPGSIFQCSEHASRCKLYKDDHGGYGRDTTEDDSGFTSVISQEIIGPEEIKIYVTVSWEQGTMTYDITLAEDLFNWVELE
ncbi:MAG: prepilin-type N-terminal cleavage/methylation domain-containing protein [Candidatus Paceibacterota bacterium]|jgi:type II secretory pathway pseudopilin PulG